MNRRIHKPFSKEQFEYALELTSKFGEFPEEWYSSEEETGLVTNEYCYVIPIIFSNPIRILKIYSSVDKDTNKSRKVNGDAIRVVLADSKGEPVHGPFTRINRNGNWEWNLRLRISEALEFLGFNTICPLCRCGSILFLRWNRNDDRRFLGCSKWKKDGGCKGSRPFKDGSSSF